MESHNLSTPFLDQPRQPPASSANGRQHNRHTTGKKRSMSIRVDSFCLASNARRAPESSNLRVQSFRATARALQLDHSHTNWSLLSWVVGLLLLVVVPVLRLCFVKAVTTSTEHELVFQPLVVYVGIALSVVSFLFLSQAIRRHGIRGVLFLDAAEEEVMEVRNEYDAIIEQSRIQLAKLFFPVLLVYIIFRAWFYTQIELQTLPFGTISSAASLAIIMVFVTISWIFQTTTYLYTCILFSTVCALQELKMKKFKDLLGKGLDPEFYYYKYARIIKGLQATSRRFRLFLALIMTITIIGFLASMYKVVAAERAGMDTLMAGEIVVLNLVNLIGVGLCLRSASKLSHFHRRIVKAAAAMHATGTFEAADSAIIGTDGKDTLLEWLDKFYQIQDAWSRRAALVNFLSSTSVGISVYGFVLDRFFVHTSVGALLTTTWFILGRSLST